MRTTLNTANALAERGHDVEILSLLKGRPDPSYPIADPVRIRILTPSRQLFAPGWTAPRRFLRRTARKILERWPSRIFPPGDKWYGRVSRFTDVALKRYLRRQHGCVLIGTNPGLNFALAQLAPPDAITIGQEHLHLGRRAASRRQLIRAHYPALDAVVTLTETDSDAYRALLPDTHIESIPNAVPHQPFRRHSLETERSQTVVAAGRLTPQKGFDQLISAWALVHRDHPEWRLAIYGSGPEQPHLQSMIDEQALSETISLAGHVDDLPEVLRSAGLFVLSSRYEGFPMVLLEAMSCAVPVVAFDCPTGPSELIKDRVTGRLVPAGETAELAAAISSLIEQPSLRSQFGQAAATHARTYDRDLIATRWENLFQRLHHTHENKPRPT
ncbi:glycosyltransferase family 4 protein [Microlunatus aurantiacus]|uniref:glycosyltransferase family 4 protein n=1 Tax=Microlunatus aurantiacus TaxID=446786 RepID=UPI0031DFDE7E